jgi:hypothetical protein
MKQTGEYGLLDNVLKLGISPPTFRRDISLSSSGQKSKRSKKSAISRRQRESWFILRHWRWRLYVPPNRRWTSAEPDGVTVEKIVLWIVTAVRTSNPTKKTEVCYISFRMLTVREWIHVRGIVYSFQEMHKLTYNDGVFLFISLSTIMPNGSGVSVILGVCVKSHDIWRQRIVVCLWSSGMWRCVV